MGEINYNQSTQNYLVIQNQSTGGARFSLPISLLSRRVIVTQPPTYPFYLVSEYYLSVIFYKRSTTNHPTSVDCVFFIRITLILHFWVRLGVLNIIQDEINDQQEYFFVMNFLLLNLSTNSYRHSGLLALMSNFRELMDRLYVWQPYPIILSTLNIRGDYVVRFFLNFDLTFRQYFSIFHYSRCFSELMVGGLIAILLARLKFSFQVSYLLFRCISLCLVLRDGGVCLVRGTYSSSYLEFLSFVRCWEPLLLNTLVCSSSLFFNCPSIIDSMLWMCNLRFFCSKSFIGRIQLYGIYCNYHIAQE